MAHGTRSRLTGLAAMALAAWFLPAPASANPRSAELRRAGFQLAYNLDYDEALATLRRAVEADPEDSASYRAIATIAWLNLLFARGALTADEFLSSLPESHAKVQAPPAPGPPSCGAPGSSWPTTSTTTRRSPRFAARSRPIPEIPRLTGPLPRSRG